MEHLEQDTRRWHARKPYQQDQISSTTKSKRKFKPKNQEKTVESLSKDIAKLKAIITNCQRKLDEAIRDRQLLWHPPMLYPI